jgi:hypothetical protein
LQQVFKERNAPAHQRCDNPWTAREILQVPIPGKRHKNIRADEQSGCLPKGGGEDDVHRKVVMKRFEQIELPGAKA